MSGRNNPIRSHYFVPLGRERGGYLDFLGLPPDVDIGEVGRKKTEYLKSVESAFKQQRKAVRKERDEDKTISPQEYEAKLEQLEEERTKKERKLNELQAKFDVTQAEKRGAKSSGRQEEVSWLRMFCWFGDAPQEFWRFLLRPRPPASVPQGLLLEIEQRWIGPHVNGQRDAHKQTTFHHLASQAGSTKGPVDLTTLAALITERDLICLLAADALWSEIRYTNREHWHEVIEQWAMEVATLGPRLLHEASGPEPVDYPALHRPTKLMIEHVEEEEVAEVTQAPERGTNFQRETELETLLAELLAQEQTQSGDQEAADSPEKITLEPHQLEEILALLRQGNEAEAD